MPLQLCGGCGRHQATFSCQQLNCANCMYEWNLLCIGLTRHVLSIGPTCAVVYEIDADFGNMNVIPLSTAEASDAISPSQMIERNSISHLGREQRAELSAMLARYQECFWDTPGITVVVARSVPLDQGLGSRCLHACRVRERLKPSGMILLYILTSGRKNSRKTCATTECLCRLY